jgi:hypothetical protein
MSETATGSYGYPEECNEFLKESQSFATDFYFPIRFATKIADQVYREDWIEFLIISAYVHDNVIACNLG